jgi:hypothetical protein
MNRISDSKNLAGVLAIAVLLFLGDFARAEAAENESALAGPYMALLDLGALGAPRIEALGVYLDSNGGVLLMSEHEDDKESAGVGVWRLLRGGRIGIGVFSFRFGPEPGAGACGLIGVTSPPDNCILKVGGTLARKKGFLEGELFLTIESLDGLTVLTVPAPLPITMERLSLADFPGALP